MADSRLSKREQILNTALDLIAEHGFHGASVSMIASQADVGMGTIYRYFDSKETLINELYRRIKKDLIDAMHSGSDENKSIQERFALIWGNLATFYIHHPKALSFMEQYDNSPFIERIPEDEKRELEAEIYKFVETAQKQGVVKAIPAPILIVNVYATVVALVKLHLSGDFGLTTDTMSMAIETSWDAIRK